MDELTTAYHPANGLKTDNAGADPRTGATAKHKSISDKHGAQRRENYHSQVMKFSRVRRRRGSKPPW